MCLRLECAVGLFQVALLVDHLSELLVVELTTLLRLQVERLRHSVLRSFVFRLRGTGEQVTWLWVLQVALVGIHGKLVIETEDLGLAE